MAFRAGTWGKKDPKTEKRLFSEVMYVLNEAEDGSMVLSIPTVFTDGR